jgi:hypothetical protein
MKLYFLLILIVLLSLPSGHAAIPVINPPTTGSQLFFDDFTGSTFPSQWSSGTIIGINNATQTGGYLTTTILRNALTFNNAYSIRMIANNTSPTISSTDTAKFVQLVYKMQPFNLTNPLLLSYNTGSGVPSTFPIVADIQFGLTSEAIHGGSGSFPRNSLYFELIESTVPLNRVDPTLPAQKQAVLLATNGGPASAALSFTPDLLVCCPATLGMLYNGQNAPFDLNQMHTFTMQLNLNTTNAASEYVRYQVDNDGWMTFWETGCTCIGTGAVTNVYPFFTLTYLVGNSAGILTSPFVINQSLASQIDYVLATNYVPAGLPNGQLLSSNINPPLKNLGIYQPGGFSLTQYVQFEANNMGQGNIYAGGLFLTGIFLLIITLGLAGVMWKTRMGFSIFGMIWNISTLAFIYLMFYCGVIPLVIPVLVTIGAAAILFGIFRSGPPSIGGEVQS